MPTPREIEAATIPQGMRHAAALLVLAGMVGIFAHVANWWHAHPVLDGQPTAVNPFDSWLRAMNWAILLSAVGCIVAATSYARGRSWGGVGAILSSGVLTVAALAFLRETIAHSVIVSYSLAATCVVGPVALSAVAVMFKQQRALVAARRNLADKGASIG